MSKATAARTLLPGDAVRFAAVPARLKHLQHCTGDLRETGIGPGGDLSRVVFDDGSTVGKEVVLATVHLARVTPARADGKAARRAPFYLHDPAPDPRDEAERLNDAASLLEQWGYQVLRVGQGKASAVCHACSRKSRERGGPPLVRIKCRDCGSQGYSPSTNSTEGTPDTFVGRAGWPPGDWFGVEWKDAPNGARQPAQKRLEAIGCIVVAWNEASCFVPLARHETALGVEPAPPLVAYLAARGLWPLPDEAGDPAEAATGQKVDP